MREGLAATKSNFEVVKNEISSVNESFLSFLYVELHRATRQILHKSSKASELETTICIFEFCVLVLFESVIGYTQTLQSFTQIQEFVFLDFCDLVLRRVQRSTLKVIILEVRSRKQISPLQLQSGFI